MKRLRLATRVVLWFLLSGLVVFGQTEPDASAPKNTPAATFSIDLKPDANGKLSQEQMQQLFRIVADKDIENDKRLRDYTYIERDEEHKLDGQGQSKSTKSETYEVMEL